MGVAWCITRTFYGHGAAHLWAFHGNSAAHFMGTEWAWKLCLQHTRYRTDGDGLFVPSQGFRYRNFLLQKFLLQVLKRGEVQKRGTPLLVHVSIGGRCGASFAYTISGVFASANTPLPPPQTFRIK